MVDGFDALQQWLFELGVQPVLLLLDAGTWVEDAYRATAWFLWGCIQIAVIVLVIAPLEKRRPAEPLTNPATVRVDVLYTLIHRLSLFRLAAFLLGLLAIEALEQFAPEFEIPRLHLDQLVAGWTDIALVSFVIYLVVLDFADYWIHRAQHGLRAWWALHSLHHAQTQMTVWSDNRNHLLDDLLRDALLAMVALVVGVSPAQFVALVAVTQLLESLQHANVRLSFGHWGNRLLVAPVFHRLHHSIEFGFGKNFGVLFPWWDALFGTAKFDVIYAPTGVDDGRDYGAGFWAQQRLGLRRLMAIVRST